MRQVRVGPEIIFAFCGFSFCFFARQSPCHPLRTVGDGAVGKGIACMVDDDALVGNGGNLHILVGDGCGIGEEVSGTVEEICRDNAHGEKDCGEESVHENAFVVIIL